MQPRSQRWETQFIVTAKSKGDTPEENFSRFFYENMVSPISDGSYDEGLQESAF